MVEASHVPRFNPVLPVLTYFEYAPLRVTENHDFRLASF
ncbi:hypothetical protein L286_19775 [Sphingobium sp. HDIP04]|nr:hypothetical protein L286_19775 [Sphingobium sp. HDIP04]